MHAESIPWYSRSLDFEQLARDYPPPPDYFRTTFRISSDELRALQERRFLETMRRGWEIPFFERHWRNAGMQPGDVRGLDELTKIPPYDVHHIRQSIEEHPPFGDFMGISPADGQRMPLVLQTSGGTTACRGRCCMRHRTAKRWRSWAAADLRCTACGPAIWCSSPMRLASPTARRPRAKRCGAIPARCRS
jgi:phenylacetate-coenzyme A ligase PaaK-like adenylate-forming protein